MKIHSWHLIIGSIILFLFDFLILANKTIFPNQQMKGISTVIALACALVFVTGIMWAIFEPIAKRIKSRPAASAAPPMMASEKSRLALTTLEIVFNRLFAVLLVLSAVPLILNPLTIPTIIIFIIFALFLWFSKKYHLSANIIFLIFALGIYFIQIPPIAWGIFRGLKEFRIGGFDFHQFTLLFCVAPLIFISFSVRNILGNIFAYFKTNVSRNAFYLISLFIVFVTLPAYPLLDSIRLRDRTRNVNTAVGGDLSLVYTQQSLTFIDRYNMAGNFTSNFDSSTKKYIYHLQLLEPLKKDIQFTKVETDGEKINFTTDSRIACSNCQKDMSDPYGLIFPAGKDIDFTIVNDWLIKTINFTEPGDKVDEFIFWK
ncbi:hypothetical protein HZB93_04155 [Candidatus Falkowbacteria bacterium]|nr:hypothetical protein [Candidatus Falkowbacteria bacterium]